MGITRWLSNALSKRKMKCPGPLALIAAMLAACLILPGCQGERPGSAVQVLVDGKPFEGGAISPEAAEDLRVYVTLDGEPLVDLPFSEAHSVRIVQPDKAENAVTLTGERVYMESANCENQDCVHMGEVTRENLELRVMGGFIICLPHRLSVEVRGK